MPSQDIALQLQSITSKNCESFHFGTVLENLVSPSMYWKLNGFGIKVVKIRENEVGKANRIFRNGPEWLVTKPMNIYIELSNWCILLFTLWYVMLLVYRYSGSVFEHKKHRKIKLPST
jgi:hypothetical protein